MAEYNSSYTGVQIDDAVGKSLAALPTDNTLSAAGKAADAKKTGDEISGLKSALETFKVDSSYEIDPTQATEYYPVSINSSNKWSSGAGKRGYFYAKPNGANRISITANSSNHAVFAMLKNTTHTTGSAVAYATGTSVCGIASNTTETYDIPNDCNYLYFYGYNGNTIYLPSYVEIIDVGYTDKSLTLSGKSADSKATGDRINSITNGLDERFKSSGANYSLATDSTFYVDKIPSYYIDPPTTPSSFDEIQGYLDNKIATIPKNGKSFIFITDTHWDGNTKHSPDLIAYIRERTGINKVLFGGDVYGNANDKYLAAKKANGYLLPSKRSTAYDFLPCVGDHDNNTVSVPSDSTHWLPYAQVEELFVGDLERYVGYHWYDCREKLADFATPGSDDYNEAVAFFHTVYYVDDENLKIRFISLNCGNAGAYGGMYNIFGESGTHLLRLQFDWLVDTMMSTQSGWDIVLLSHKGNGGNGGVSADILNSIVYNFRIKNPTASGSPSSSTTAIEQWWPHSWSYDFSHAPSVRYIIAINGHEHEDRLMAWGKSNGTYSKNALYVASGSTINQPDSGTSNNIQIPLIVTNCDSLGVAGSNSPTMTAGTVTEQCIDVITITDTGLVMTRIGAGDDRSLTITRTL